jgi:hypothetical protein
MQLQTLTEGARIEWKHYPATDAQPETKTGLVAVAADDVSKALLAQTEDGQVFEVREEDGQLVSSPAASTAPPANAAQAATIAGNGDTVPEPPSEGEIPAKLPTPIGVTYFGPAYHQAVDMLVEILGPAMRGAGHISETLPGDSNIETLYCFVIETDPDLARLHDRMEEIERKIRSHKHSEHFAELVILNEEQVEKAAATVDGGALPILES